MTKKSSMSVSGIGIQLIQTLSGTAQEPMMTDQNDNHDDDRVAPAEPSRSPPPPGMGRYVDKDA